MSKSIKKIKRKKSVGIFKSEKIWIDPVGGLGDILMLSGVLKLVYESNPLKKFNLVHHSRYTHLLKSHPAIKYVGFPPKNAIVLKSDYWHVENFEKGNLRAFQALALKFGLKTPVKEKLFLSENIENDILLDKIIPWKKKNIIIAPSSDSPRKMLPYKTWLEIVKRLVSDDILVLQVGTKNDFYIKGTYSLLNLTSFRQLISLIKKCNFVICLDSLIMHIAHLTDKPALVLWGPTKSEIFGYTEQIHLQAPTVNCEQKNKCITPDYIVNYPTECPYGQEHCMNKISFEKIFNSIYSLL